MHRGVCPRAIAALRVVLALLLAMGLWTVGRAHASDVEYLMVPSAAMGRGIPVAFRSGGPHAVVLLDAFDAGAAVSNWVTAGGAVNALAGKGVSLVAPAGGAFSLYTNWERDSSKQWETFLSSELLEWFAANKGLAPDGHAVVGAAQGGTAAMTLAEFYPGRYRYAGSMSGFLYPSNTVINGALHDGMMRFGNADTDRMWGPAQLGRWKWRDPYVHAQLLADHGTRVWVFSPSTLTCVDPAAMVGHCDQAQGSSKSFQTQYRNAFGSNGHFDFPTTGNHDWPTWSAQLAAMAGDISATIGQE